MNIRAIALLIVMPLIVYAIGWRVWYALDKPVRTTIDLRSACPPQKAMSNHAAVVTFYSAFASNPHGFPGHAYIGWSVHGKPEQTRGYVPKFPLDQLQSLYKEVPGLVVHAASEGNRRHLSSISVLVDTEDLQKVIAAEQHWSRENFKAGERDCVAFVDNIAAQLDLQRPDHRYKFPQDYIRQLKELNARVDGIPADGTLAHSRGTRAGANIQNATTAAKVDRAL